MATPTGTPEERLQALLLEIGRAKGLRAKVKLVETSLGFVRSLSARDRERVAMRVGSQWAWSAIEQLLARDGKLDERDQLVQRVFERVTSKEPDDFRTYMRDVREVGLAEVGRRVAGEAFAAASDVETSEWVEIARSGAEGDLAPLERVAGEVVSEMLGDVAESADVPGDAREAIATPAPTPTPASEPLVEIAKVEAPRASAAPARTAPAVTRAPAPAAARAPEPVSVAPPPTAELPFTTARDRLRALRSLRESPSTLRDATPDERRRFLARFGGGWAARRATSQLVRARAMRDVDEALGWVEALDSDTRRAFCLGDLLELEELDAADTERIVAAAPSDAVRRRLERRAKARGRARRT